MYSLSNGTIASEVTYVVTSDKRRRAVSLHLLSFLCTLAEYHVRLLVT